MLEYPVRCRGRVRSSNACSFPAMPVRNCSRRVKASCEVPPTSSMGIVLLEHWSAAIWQMFMMGTFVAVAKYQRALLTTYDRELMPGHGILPSLAEWGAWAGPSPDVRAISTPGWRSGACCSAETTCSPWCYRVVNWVAPDRLAHHSCQVKTSQTAPLVHEYFGEQLRIAVRATHRGWARGASRNASEGIPWIEKGIRETYAEYRRQKDSASGGHGFRLPLWWSPVHRITRKPRLFVGRRAGKMKLHASPASPRDRAESDGFGQLFSLAKWYRRSGFLDGFAVLSCLFVLGFA